MTAPPPLPRQLIAVEGRTADALDEKTVAQLAAKALAAERTALLLRPSPRARAIAAALPGAPAIAVLPDMAQLLRDAAEQGAVGAALRRLRAGGAPAWLRLGVTVTRHLASIAAQDFRGIVPALIELERAALGAARPQAVALAAPLTDLLLAAGHRECLAHLVVFLRGRGAMLAGFETLNLGHLLRRLAEWEVRPDFVIGPVNPRGFRMKPNPAAVLAAVRESATPVLASEPTASGTVAVADAVAYAHAAGAAGVVLRVGEVDARP